VQKLQKAMKVVKKQNKLRKNIKIPQILKGAKKDE
jgi:hypothetical protein